MQMEKEVDSQGFAQKSWEEPALGIFRNSPSDSGF